MPHTPQSLSPDTRVDTERFSATLARSAEIGVGREGGLSRLALTDADREMRDVFVSWCREAGLSVTIDRVGNIFARRQGQDNDLPPVVMGSHLDTQANGGRFDGIVGVLGALEVVRRLNDIGHITRRPIEIVNWTNEEGGRFSPPMTASGCFAGAYPVDWVHERPSDDGATFGGELARIGYLGEAPVGERPLDAYFELHIEQGPILDSERIQIGVVTHAYTSHGFLVSFNGETAHTGPWPMERRKNALVAAARFLVAVDNIGWDFAGTGGKGTASRLVAWPNKAGILSDWAEAVCDVRHEDPAAAAVMAERVIRAVSEAAARAGCTAEIRDRWDWGGAIFDADLVSVVRETARMLGYSHRDLPSQAGHDAYFLARVCPTTMIFTPCRGGVTHNNNEFAGQEDLEPGLNVLLHSTVARADR
ncbi:Zn-dependent hydrolase [Microvirga makkahensis]|uniref:Hydantoinase/carbamoylase family amidase n=1 Tax=Microvirga makkahensis TaxID=1128670 RepID=A0A7X3MPE3_9HYPH|nr:Zn-dependent hydrolase [Microvirga makkahensis]MXQ10779.1 hydantoinase/carbamoylase family amidase [Microvirga makkahensis]